MPLYRYIKAPAYVPKRRIRPPLALSMILMTVGSGILIWVAWPIIAFALFTAPLFSQTISPIPDAATITRAGVAPRVLAVNTVAESIAPTVDYTNANRWFPTKPQKKVVTPVNGYKLAIPKLRINNASVTIAGDDLNKSLIHYGGTGLPGEYGTAVIFGHSILPQFYNPKDYRSIFSLLPTLKLGDDIFIDYDNVRYRYVVYEMVVLDPSDLSSLEQRFDDSYITLITCVPPGTYYQRLNVRAKLTRL